MPQEQSASAYENFARKYRPEKFSEMVGQNAVTQTLSNALKLNRVAHAYLFYGPRGCGKTTAARILAKALNCQNSPDNKPVTEPCGKCPACLEIAQGNDLDVLEIDAASHTQVEKIREVIIDTVSLSSNRDRYKVFILDEAHMLSTSSFNALLKTIEEPPAHVVFILATTERHKIPPTIASRCQSFRFKPIPQEDIVRCLSDIAGQEKIEIEKAALELIAKTASGAMRDAKTILDRAVSYAVGKISRDMVAEMLGYMPQDLVRQAVSAVLAKDGAALHQAFETVKAEGYDPLVFLRDIKNAVADMFYFSAGFGEPPFPGAGEVSAGMSPAAIAGIARRLNKLSDEVKFSELPIVSAEIGLFTIMSSVPDIDGFVRRLEQLEGKIASGISGEMERRGASASAAPVAAPASISRPAPVKAAAAKPESRPAVVAPVIQPIEPKISKPAPEAAPAPIDAQANGVLWKKLLDRLTSKNPLLNEILSGCRVSFKEGGSWVLDFGDEFHRDAAQRNIKRIEEAALDLAGRAIQFSFTVTPRRESRNETASSSATGDESEISEESPLVEGEFQWQDITEGGGEADAAVKKILKIIPGKVIKPHNPS